MNRGADKVLTYSFENIDSESMYEHLYRCIKQDILQQKLKPDERLPSKRTFAKNLGVSTITVESAYAQLVAEGKSVVIISSELPEVLGMSDRIYVMNEGKLVGEFNIEDATQEKIMGAILKSGNR